MTKRQLLFLPGANAPGEYYTKFLGRLSAAGYDAQVLEYPGIGNTRVLTTNAHQTEADYLNWLGEEINQRAAKNYILCGFSLGGYLAYRYALTANDPELMALALFSPLTRLYSRNLFFLSLRFLLNEWQNFTSGRENLSYPLFHWRSLQYLEGKFAQSDFVRALEPQFIHGQVDLPMLVYTGARDLVVDTGFTEKLFAGREKIKLVIQPELGHDAFALAADEVIAELGELNARL